MDNGTIERITEALTLNYIVGALNAAEDALAPINDPAIKAIVDLIEATAYNKQLEADAVIKAALSIDPQIDIWDIAAGYTP